MKHYYIGKDYKMASFYILQKCESDYFSDQNMIVYEYFEKCPPKNGSKIEIVPFKEHNNALWIRRKNRLCLENYPNFYLSIKGGKIPILQKDCLCSGINVFSPSGSRFKRVGSFISISNHYLCLQHSLELKLLPRKSLDITPTEWALISPENISEYSRNDFISTYESINEAYDINSNQLAFPGVQGYGSYSKGGRGGNLYCVTSLKDNENEFGTLRYGVEKMSRPLNIFFSARGVLYLRKPLNITIGFLTIDGSVIENDNRTIQITGAGIEVTNYAENIILRYLQVALRLDEKHAFYIRNARNIVVDHCSLSCKNGPILTITSSSVPPTEQDTDLITIQNCFIYNLPSSNGDLVEKINEFSTTFTTSDNGRISIIQNLFAHCDIGSPRIGHSSVQGYVAPAYIDFRNNLIYNWGRIPGCNVSKSNGPVRFNFVNNAYISGPNTEDQQHIFIEMGSKRSKGYFEGNSINEKIEERKCEFVKFEPMLWAQIDRENYRETQLYPTINTETFSVEHVFDRVLNYSGTTSPRRSESDIQIIRNVKYCCGA